MTQSVVWNSKTVANNPSARESCALTSRMSLCLIYHFIETKDAFMSSVKKNHDALSGGVFLVSPLVWNNTGSLQARTSKDVSGKDILVNDEKQAFFLHLFEQEKENFLSHRRLHFSLFFVRRGYDVLPAAEREKTLLSIQTTRERNSRLSGTSDTEGGEAVVWHKSIPDCERDRERKLKWSSHHLHDSVSRETSKDRKEHRNSHSEDLSPTGNPADRLSLYTFYSLTYQLFVYIIPSLSPTRTSP
jgi:hypothetical protein